MASVPNSLGYCLKYTTREPLFVHPKFWSEAHLQKLRVRGFDKNVPLEQVIQRSLSESHAFQAAIQDPKLSFKPLLDLVKMNMDAGVPGYFTQQLLIGLCNEWSRDILHKLRCRPEMRRSAWKHWFPDHILPFQFGDAVVDIPTEGCLHGYPEPAEYPISFPIVACIRDETNDDIALNPEAGSNVPVPRSQDMSISKQTRIISVLAAMAEKQAETLKRDRFSEDVALEQLSFFHPALIVVSSDCVQFVRAHVSRTYLDALEDPSQPLVHDFNIEQSVQLRLADDQFFEKIFTCLTALVDSYLQLEGLFYIRHPPPARAIQQSLWSRSPQAPPASGTACGGRKGPNFRPRRWFLQRTEMPHT